MGASGVFQFAEFVYHRGGLVEAEITDHFKQDESFFLMHASIAFNFKGCTPVEVVRGNPCSTRLGLC